MSFVEGARNEGKFTIQFSAPTDFFDLSFAAPCGWAIVRTETKGTRRTRMLIKVVMGVRP